MPLEKNIKIVYTFHFLHGLMFFLPVFALLLEEKLGSILLVTALLAVQAALFALFEVPSGAISDKIGRKKNHHPRRIILIHSTHIPLHRNIIHHPKHLCFM